MRTFTARQLMMAAAAGVRGDVFNAAMAADVDPSDVDALLAFQEGFVSVTAPVEAPNP